MPPAYCAPRSISPGSSAAVSQFYLFPDYSSTVIPMLLAVPAIMLIAASMDAAFKSGIFISAISLTLSLEMDATFVLFGTAEPDLMLHAFFISTAAGGVLVTKLKLLSAYTVITTGIIVSPLSAVLALNCLVN